jgi:octaprenyl-diphosphate synthase
MNLQDVFTLNQERLQLVELKLKELFKNNIPYISLIGNYLISSGGKRLRPLIHLLSADISGYKGDAHIAIAGIFESIHTASLLHDDVIDNAAIRRGKTTANSMWGNQVVILVGDFLYSNALRVAVMQKNQRIMEVLSFATSRMTEGELLQLNRIGNPDIREEEYIEIISAKTGVLVSAACRAGAILGEIPEKHEKALAHFGMKTGIVFQMADDILDYMADENELGKRLGKDLEEGKITLPLIYILEVAEENEVNEIKKIISDDFSEKGILRIMSMLKKYNAIDISFKKAQLLVDEAKAELTDFPDSKAKNELLAIADYSLHRDK